MFRVLVLLGCAVCASTFAADVKPLWVAKGFAQPESALYVAAEKAIFVSSIDGDPVAKDGKGFISLLDPAGKLISLQWVGGLDAPKGMAYAQGRLFVTDIDQVIEIDVKRAQIVKRYSAKGAKFLNDIALEPRSNFKGQVARAYISDSGDNAIWYLGDGKLAKLLSDPALDAPNGLLVEGEMLRIASLGTLPKDGAPAVLGRLKTMPLDEDSISDRFGPEPIGSLDGLEADGKGGYWVSDWITGKVYRIDSTGTPSVWLSLEQGTADIGIIPGKAMLVPMMLNGELRAYPLPK